MVWVELVMDKKGDKMIKRVAVIDDEKFTHKLVQQFLSQLGYEAVFFESGEEALKYLQQDNHFDLILLDYLMAGIDGYETLHHLKEKEWTKSIPVIIVSALDDEEEKNRLIKAGAMAFIAKPLQYHSLIETIQKSIRSD